MRLQWSYIEETEATATAKGSTYGKKHTPKEITQSEKKLEALYTEKLYTVLIPDNWLKKQKYSFLKHIVLTVRT